MTNDSQLVDRASMMTPPPDRPTSEKSPMQDLMTIFRSLQTGLEAHRPHLGNASAVTASTKTVVPVTLLTGFLGAGKSTLLASLLLDPPDGMIVKAVVNDLGLLPLDPTFMVDDEYLEVELANGCGCCQSTTDVAASLARLAATSPDLLVLEASGVADPLALAQIVEADPGLELDRIVAVVDALTFDAQLADAMLGSIISRQLAAAHSVIVSRADLIEPQVQVELLHRLADLAPGCAITTSSLDEPAAASLVPGSIRGASLPVEGAVPGHDLITLTTNQTIPVRRETIEAALAAAGPAIVRCKGSLSTYDDDVLVQATGSNWSVRAIARGDNEPSTVTIIGTEAVAVVSLALALGCPD